MSLKDILEVKILKDKPIYQSVCDVGSYWNPGIEKIIRTKRHKIEK